MRWLAAVVALCALGSGFSSSSGAGRDLLGQAAAAAAAGLGRAEPSEALGGSNSYYYSHWCGAGLQYLDDAKCAKVFPSTSDRGFSCGIGYTSESELPPGYARDAQFSSIEPHPLDNVVTNGADACVILTRRVKGVLFNKYYCTARKEAYETWSSSKIFAMANAAGTLRGRENSTCSPAGALGIDSATTGKASSNGGPLLLGDLATIVCSYDHTAGYSSNSLSSFFHDLGWRRAIHDLVQSDWLAATTNYSVGVSLGGNYGEATPADLGFRLTSTSASCNAIPKPVSAQPVYSNSLTALAAAELTRRLVQHSAIDPALRFPFLQPEDVATILQGADVAAHADSTLFPGQLLGGMSADTSVFLQSWLDMKQVESASAGQWRIYSKLGSGFSSSRRVGEIINNVYACLPGVFGVEMTLHVRGSVPEDSDLSSVEQVVHAAVGSIVSALKAGAIA